MLSGRAELCRHASALPDGTERAIPANLAKQYGVAG